MLLFSPASTLATLTDTQRYLVVYDHFPAGLSVNLSGVFAREREREREGKMVKAKGWVADETEGLRWGVGDPIYMWWRRPYLWGPTGADDVAAPAS